MLCSKYYSPKTTNYPAEYLPKFHENERAFSMSVSRILVHGTAPTVEKQTSSCESKGVVIPHVASSRVGLHDIVIHVHAKLITRSDTADGEHSELAQRLKIAAALR